MRDWGFNSSVLEELGLLRCDDVCGSRRFGSGLILYDEEDQKEYPNGETVGDIYVCWPRW